MKQCFVIMPYGGNDPDLKRHYEGVYLSIIAQAAREAGYKPKRSDMAGEPGNITHDIIRDLAESDIVIADLTSANPNVFFELGIRHAFRKSGTIHIIDEKHELSNFDVRQYRAIEYSRDLADIPGVISKINDTIRKLESHPERSDNPVHDAIPHLPLSITMVGDQALQEQLRSTQKALEQLHQENEKLGRRLAELDPSGEAGALRFVDVDAELDRADEIMRSTGKHALLRLHKALEAGGPDEFAKELRGVLKSPYLDQMDFMGIVGLCRQAGLNDHRRATLEVARQRYPHEDNLFDAFIDALDDSPNPVDKERGRLMLEERIGIEHGQGGPKLKPGKSALSSMRFGLLFNFYLAAGRCEWILSLTEDPPRSMQNLMLRNRAKALAMLGRTNEARMVYDQAMDFDPDDVTLKWFADFLDDEGEFAEAYSRFEQAILADPEDGTNYLALSVHILNRGVYRDASGEIGSPLPRRARLRVAIPVIMMGLHRDSYRADLVRQEAVKVLVRAGAGREAEAIAVGNSPEGKFDTSVVDYLASQIEAEAKE